MPVTELLLLLSKRTIAMAGLLSSFTIPTVTDFVICIHRYANTGVMTSVCAVGH